MKKILSLNNCNPNPDPGNLLPNSAKIFKHPRRRLAGWHLFHCCAILCRKSFVTALRSTIAFKALGKCPPPPDRLRFGCRGRPRPGHFGGVTRNNALHKVAARPEMESSGTTSHPRGGGERVVLTSALNWPICPFVLSGFLQAWPAQRLTSRDRPGR